MTTLGAILMVVGFLVFTVAFVAGLYSVFGVWAGLAGASFVAVAVGRFLVLSSGGDE